MADRPIIFSAPMVRALLDGRKTQTRRLLKPEPELFPIDAKGTSCTVSAVQVDGDAFHRVALGSEKAGVLTAQRIHYGIGDRLYVREAWAPLSACTTNDPGTRALADGGFYRADCSTVEGEISRWRPSIHMPRSASRMTLTVEAVKVERLQAISEADALAEGAFRGQASGRIGDSYGAIAFGDWFATARGWYRDLWNRLHGADAWEADPFVVALTFRVERANIDRLAVAHG